MGLAFVDLRKAFDTVSHNILLTKSNNNGFRGVTHTLIRSYLDNRQQFVSINHSQSNLKPIKVGFPQGSSLCPMFFLIYINDLHNLLKSETRLFADDTCLLIKGSNSQQLEINLNAELQHLHLWCSVNKLSVYTAKTNIVIIPPKRIKAPISHLNLSSNGTPVNIVSSAKYLGVIIDNELNFHEQIKVMNGKGARSVGILNKLKQSLPQTVMLQLYYALVHALLMYVIWGATYPTYLQKLKSLQN